MNSALQLLVSGMAFGSIDALLALSFALVLRTTGIWNFGSAGVFAVVGYAGWLLAESSLPLAVAVVLSLMVSAILMVAVDSAVHKPLRARGANREIVMVGSLTVAFVADAVLGVIFGTNIQTYPRHILGSVHRLHRVVILGWDVGAVVVMVICLVLVLGVLHWTPFGRTVRAYGDNPQLSVVLGQAPWLPHAGSFVLASVPLGAAALMTGIHSGVGPGRGLTAILIASAAAILGGYRSTIGPVMGGLILGLATTLPLLWLSASWQNTIAFGILIAVIFFRPEGLFRHGRAEKG